MIQTLAAAFSQPMKDGQKGEETHARNPGRLQDATVGIEPGAQWKKMAPDWTC